MKILHISDTHGLHKRLNNLPDADIIVHSGDFTINGTVSEALNFMNWFCDLPYEHKIFIAGNHDFCLYGAEIGGLERNCHYLKHSGISIDGAHFYGIPMFIQESVQEFEKNVRQIPKDTDVLITHAPPYGILDSDGMCNYGSQEILSIISDIRPRFHLFGHIHNARGLSRDKLSGTIYSNASLLAIDKNELLIPISS